MRHAFGRILIALIIAVLAACKPPGSTATTFSGDAEAQQGMKLIEQRKFVEAIPLLESSLTKTISIYSRSIVLTSAGNCYCEIDEFEKALQFHDKAIAEDSKNYRAYVNKGVTLRLQGKYDQAEENYLKALSIAPDYAEVHASLGSLAIFRDDPLKAIRHLEKAIALNDSLAVAHSNLAVAYAAAGRFDDAHASLKKAVVRGYHQPEVIRARIESLRSGE